MTVAAGRRHVLFEKPERVMNELEATGCSVAGDHQLGVRISLEQPEQRSWPFGQDGVFTISELCGPSRLHDTTGEKDLRLLQPDNDVVTGVTRPGVIEQYRQWTNLELLLLVEAVDL